MVLILSCKLELPRRLFIMLIPDAHARGSYLELLGWDPGICIFKNCTLSCCKFGALFLKMEGKENSLMYY